MSEKTKGELLKEQLFYKKENGLKNTDDEKWSVITDFCEGYKRYLSLGKTEREAAKISIAIAEQAGFKPYDKNNKFMPSLNARAFL